ncbi:MAG: hypothetical protein KGR47_09390 [Acidobacteria bacterium]|nr:hypothetical protein [Acidobacteriota bacterium]
MKARITTVLSLSGILVAGSAAAMVNSQVLRDDAPVQAGAAEIISRSSAPAVTVPSASMLPATQAAYEVGEPGSITLDTEGDVLSLVAPTPAPGWTVVKVEQADPRSLTVVFQSAGQLATFTAGLVQGVVSTDVKVQSLAIPAGIGTIAPPSTGDDGDGGDGGDGGGVIVTFPTTPGSAPVSIRISTPSTTPKNTVVVSRPVTSISAPGVTVTTVDDSSGKDDSGKDDSSGKGRGRGGKGGGGSDDD